MALKVLSSHINNEEGFVEKFSEMACLKHDNIVKLLGWTEIWGRKGILMEYIEGGRLIEGE